MRKYLFLSILLSTPVLSADNNVCFSVAELAKTIVTAKSVGGSKTQITDLVNSFKQEDIYGAISRQTGLYIIEEVYSDKPISKDTAIQKAFAYCNKNLK